MSQRTSCFDGSFYPADAHEIERYLEAFNRTEAPKLDARIRAVIVPHAGYVYSGFTANLVFRQFEAVRPGRVIVIGPSHRVPFEGMSVSLFDTYATPLGSLEVDRAYAQTLQERHALAFEPAMHREHSTEVQMPFIKHYAPEAKVVELVYGRYAPARLAEVIDTLLLDPQNLVVISTDLSHFYSEPEANKLDAVCLEAIRNEDVSLLDQGCEACGKIGVEAMLIAAKRAGLRSQLVDYRTSAWASHDTERVVGYASAVFYPR